MNRVMGSGSKLWLVIARPDRLHAALLAAQALGEQFTGGCHLIREDSVWWQRADWQRWTHRFESVQAFPRVEACRGLIDLPRFYRETAARRAAMAELDIDSERDVLLVLGGVLAIGNAAVSANPRVFKILAVAKNAYEDLMRPIDRTRYRFTTSGWFQNRLVDRALGMNRTIYMKPRVNPGGDGVRLSRLEKEPTQIYDRIVISSNSGRDFPSGATEQMIPALHPTIAELRDVAADRNPKGRRRVVFFGTPFLLIRNLEPRVYVDHLNVCLDYLRREYGATCTLCYRPHPAETNESAELQLGAFEVEDDREAAELYFLRHYREIAAVFSVSSTVSRIAFNNGLNAYCFWRCFPFGSTAREFFAHLMGNVPPEFEIRDLSQPPVPYVGSYQAPQGALSFSAALQDAVARRAAHHAA